MQFREASIDDVAELARLNADLMADEGHRKVLTIPQLESRMSKYFQEGHAAIIFANSERTLGYALFRDDNHDVFLRQFFVARHARREGVGREAFIWLCENVWADAERITLQVLLHNQRAINFWHAVGLDDYCIVMERRFR